MVVYKMYLFNSIRFGFLFYKFIRFCSNKFRYHLDSSLLRRNDMLYFKGQTDLIDIVIIF